MTLIAVVFAVVGIVFTIFSIMVSIDRIDVSDQVETTAVVTKITTYRIHGDRRYKTFVAYNANGHRYETELGGYLSSYYVGKEIPIYFQANSPRDIMTKSSRFTVLVYPAIGLIFATFGLSILSAPARHKMRKAALQKSGIMIHAPYVETDLNMRHSVNGIYPYQIVCRWKDPEDRTEREFRSQNLWDDPSKMIEAWNITTFTVYMDPNKKKRYAMDIDRVLELMDEKI